MNEQRTDWVGLPQGGTLPPLQLVADWVSVVADLRPPRRPVATKGI